MVPKKCLVTGASSGIGRAAAIALYANGWDVAICARRKEALEETKELMLAERGASGVSAQRQVLIFSIDLQKEEEVKQTFEQVEREFGRLDMLFNNAGIPSPKVSTEELELAKFKQIMDVNVTSAFLCAQHAIRLMKKQVPQGGRIINNGSISAYVPRPLSAAYTMSKHAILGLTKCIALDHREDNIACSQIDIGNAQSSMSEGKTNGILQANRQMAKEPVMDVKHCGVAVVYLANLPLEVNVLSQTLMATNMPFVGRG